GKISRKKRKRVSDDDDESYVLSESEREDPLIDANLSTSSHEISRKQKSTEGDAVDNTSEIVKKTVYIPYKKEEWSPLYLYRTLGDLTAAVMRQSGAEGVGRVEVGRTYGIDTMVKAGNRRVSGCITNTLKAFPNYFGQYQKMEGKYRCIKYFWKVDAQPERFKALFTEWERVSGEPCPFTIGQVIKFPKTNLSTLRISDVSLRRLLDALRLVKQKHIIVTMHRFMKSIIELEQGYGYNYQMDKKSALKCLYALERAQFLHVFEKMVVEENSSHKVQLICDANVKSANDPAVEVAIRAAIDEFHEVGRVFPHGQLRLGVKKLAEQQNQSPPSALGDFSQAELEKLEDDDFEVMTVEKRLALLRLQSIRRTLIQPTKSSEAEGGEEPEDGSHTEEAAEDSGDERGSPERGAALRGGKASANKRATKVEKHDAVPAFRANFDPAINYGHQSKMIRCFVLHQFVYQFVYGLPEGTKPTVYNR
uniref:GTF3C1 extended winged-helix domain-containing protein n=1 Tax=Parascaris univalens TaxID=6257 RepID=A0A914ZHJ6_PARUN